MRLAEAGDLDLMTDWVARFAEDVGEPGSIEDARNNAVRSVQNATLYVWEDGRPVSIAKVARSTSNGASIGGVYTPPEFRGSGYSTSCVWTLAKRMLGGGYTFCNLFTDQANPTSNSIYQKIGYAALGDALALNFNQI